MDEKTIAITCRAADTIDLDSLSAFQGALKTVSDANLARLCRSIVKHGVTAPVFVWADGGAHHVIDGHQRIKALRALRGEGWVIPPIPIAYIYADTEAEAKEKLLYITSQYGEFTADGFQAFVADLDFDLSDIRIVDTEIDFNIGGDPNTGSTAGDDAEAARGLLERFGAVPFSVFNAREGWWQARKRAWIALGIRSELGRDNRLLYASDTAGHMDYYRQKRKG